MSFETGGEFSPATKNRMQSGATGLIQFTDKTAKGLGTTTEALAKMTPEQQLDYVEKYLAAVQRQTRDAQGSLHRRCSTPMRSASLMRLSSIPPKTRTPPTLPQNAGLDTDKKGYVTVGDAYGALGAPVGEARHRQHRRQRQRE